MAIYDLENTVHAGNPIRVFDANGVELQYLVSCDTETGLVERLERCENGSFLVNKEGTEVVVVTETHPAPLRVVPTGFGK